MEHFIFLLEKLGFEVKQGKHIAVKVPGMKRFKRLDTISEDLCRESLEAMFRYGDASLAAPVNRAVSLLPARKAVFSPYQRKYYARMYRLRLAEKKRFTYKSAYLYEQIRKMHELQEEYLVVVRYDVKSYGDLFRLKLRLQQVDEELCKAQQEMYRDRALQKRTCKTAEDLEFFEASEDDYRERLKQIKLQKKDNRKKLKAVERCLERDGSLAEAEKDEVPGNSYRVQEDVEVENTVLDDAVEADVITELIILRGNSGSGKTTVAKELQKKFGYNTMPISQDEIRRNILRVKDGIDTKALPLMIELLKYGYEHSDIVILEGIMYEEWYNPLFKVANELYGSNVYSYYFDITFEETIRRHQTRSKSQEFGEEHMRGWWREKDFSAVLKEQLITCEMDANSIVAKVYADLLKEE